MNKRFEEYKEVMQELNDRGIDLLELQIWREIECFLEKELTDSQLEILYCTIERVYLKSENLRLDEIAHWCVENVDDLYDMPISEIILSIA